MKKLVFLVLIFFVLTPVLIFSLDAEKKNDSAERPWDFSLELTQLLSLQLDVEYLFNESFGFKAGFGLSPLGITSFSYNALFVYHLNLPFEHFQLDFEAGLPIAYFDFIEGRYVDWDPIIDDPYFGFAPGAALLMSYRFNEQNSLGLRLGAGVKIEHQRDTGWTDNPVLPIITLVFNF